MKWTPHTDAAAIEAVWWTGGEPNKRVFFGDSVRQSEGTVSHVKAFCTSSRFWPVVLSFLSMLTCMIPLFSTFVCTYNYLSAAECERIAYDANAWALWARIAQRGQLGSERFFGRFCFQERAWKHERSHRHSQWLTVYLNAQSLNFGFANKLKGIGCFPTVLSKAPKRTYVWHNKSAHLTLRYVLCVSALETDCDCSDCSSQCNQLNRNLIK